MGISKPGIARVRVVVLAVFFAWSGKVTAQQRNSGADPLLNLPAGSLRLDSMGNKVARQSGFIFSFNATAINPAKEIELPGSPIRLKTLLLYLDNHYHLLSRIYGNHIILHKDASLIHAAPRDVRSNGKQQTDEKRTQPVNNDSTGPSPAEQDAVCMSLLPVLRSPIPFKTTPIPPPVTMHHDGRSMAAVSSRIAPGAYHTKPALSPAIDTGRRNGKKVRKERSPIRKTDHQFFASAGLTGNETLYLSPQMNAGWPRLYGIVGWRTNFDVSGFSYGIGTSVELSDTWALQLAATSGTLSNHYHWISNDTLKGSIRAKGRLTRIGLLAAMQINSRWKIQFGPAFNFLKSARHLDIGPQGLASTLPSATDMKKQYYLLRPPYTMTDTYNDKSASGKKTWIGLQIGLFYRFR